MTSVQQFPGEGGKRLDVAATSVAGQHKSHRRNLARAASARLNAT
jgi:hypothetical protein